MRWWAGSVAVALLLPLQTSESAVRVAIARADVLAEANSSSVALGAVGYGQVLPVIGSAAGWDHVTVTVGTTRVDGFIAASAVVAAPASANVDARLIRETGVSVPGAKTTPGDGVAVAIDAAGKTKWIQPITTRAVPVDVAAGASAAAAGSAVLRAALDGRTPMPSDSAGLVTWAWFSPAGGLVDAGSRSPVLSVMYANASNLAIERVQPLLVRLVAASEQWRLVASARGRADVPFRDAADWALGSALVQSAVAGANAEGGNGLMKIRLAGPLTPGAYGVVLRDLGARPLSGSRLFSGSALAAGDLTLYGTVWAFQVK